MTAEVVSGSGTGATYTNSDTFDTAFNVTAAANDVIVVLGVENAGGVGDILSPSGYTDILSGSPGATAVFCYKVAAGGEDTTGAFGNLNVASDGGVAIVLLSGVDTSSTIDGTPTEHTNGSSTQTIPTDSGSGAVPTADGIAVAAFAGTRAFNWNDADNSYSNGFTKQVGASGLQGMASIATLEYSDTAAKKCTLTTTDSGDANWGSLALFKEASGGASTHPVNPFGHPLSGPFGGPL